MTKDSAGTVGLALAAEVPVVLQRVPPRTTDRAFATRLAEVTGREVRVVEQPLPVLPGLIRVLDARALAAGSFRAWQADREGLGTADAPLVVLLDVRAGRLLLEEAPHLASWAGGVRMPMEPVVRTTESKQERQLGENALARIFAAPGAQDPTGLADSRCRSRNRAAFCSPSGPERLSARPRRAG